MSIPAATTPTGERKTKSGANPHRPNDRPEFDGAVVHCPQQADLTATRSQTPKKGRIGQSIRPFILFHRPTLIMIGGKTEHWRFRRVSRLLRLPIQTLALPTFFKPVALPYWFQADRDLTERYADGQTESDGQSGEARAWKIFTSSCWS
ncbi:hypothetical protein HGO38_07825 [Rhizobium sp. CG5]|uniref:hypothetical protein n=1 Tax=Rhizobium sp. CG5 TaxID=2726076 RepID=UPI002033C4D3|nr:hypothetical protein [Rhizobium sp. CG5]MCM2473385.1 hypothetical protein [Rhizobium sp. CG5]